MLSFGGFSFWRACTILIVSCISWERDADAKVPTIVVNADIDAMTIPMTSNIPPSPVSIIVNGVYITD